MIKSIIFDFDGVIADSNNVKTEAFIQLFDGYSSCLKEKIKTFHLQNGGMSRFEKFRYIYENFIKEPLSDERFNKLCRDFKRFVVDRVVSAPLIDGVKNFLEENKDRYKFYIVSGTPDEEIKEIVKRRGLGIYFSDVYGSPRSKKELIEIVLKENDYSPEDVVFLGDSINDYEGAKGVGVKFVGKVSNDPAFDLFPNIILKAKIKTMDEFERYLEKKNENSI
ncbi:HAD family hydrolase [Candidatus Omnitrophota bacterium]